jgi:hypothetical protein
MREPYLNARDAAEYVGYKPSGAPADEDRQMWAFYAFVRRHKVVTQRLGRSLRFTRADLDDAVKKSTDEHMTKLERMEALAREHARGVG